jgi:acyl-coenzyme A synthetase/AMP-(fatty) acid ligase
VLSTHVGSFVQAGTPFLADLVKTVEVGAPAPTSLRIFIVTGAAVPRGLTEHASRVLGIAVCGAFGTTETCLAVKLMDRGGRILTLTSYSSTRAYPTYATLGAM